MRLNYNYFRRPPTKLWEGNVYRPHMKYDERYGFHKRVSLTLSTGGVTEGVCDRGFVTRGVWPGEGGVTRGCNQGGCGPLSWGMWSSVLEVVWSYGSPPPRTEDPPVTPSPLPPPPPPRYRQHGNTVNARSVCILLECILVSQVSLILSTGMRRTGYLLYQVFSGGVGSSPLPRYPTSSPPGLETVVAVGTHPTEMLYFIILISSDILFVSTKIKP